MLSYALAIAVAISSLILFSTAFSMSKIHRKDDFLWGAVGLFYALVLWYCARNITGTVLLGQAAASALLVSYSWQIIKLRRGILNPTQAAETNNFSIVGRINNLWKRKNPQIQSTATPLTKDPLPKVTEEDIAIPETPAEISEQTEQTTKATSTGKNPNKDPNISNQKPLRERAEKLTPQAPPNVPAVQDNADEYPNQTSKPEVIEPLPLPNKLPEVPQIDETNISSEISPDNAERKAEPETLENIPAASKSEDLSQTIPPEIEVNTSTPETKSTSEKIPEETAKPPKPKSALDSLETVEVAEVLEAEPDRQANNRESDRFSIIEVTTTEVNVTKEVIKLDQEQDSDADFDDFK
jgi:hypothetical protein